VVLEAAPEVVLVVVPELLPLVVLKPLLEADPELVPVVVLELVSDIVP